MVGSINPGAPNKYDMIELQMPRTEKDGKITKKMHRVTKMRDTILVSCLNQPNMFERMVIRICLFRWRDLENLTSSDTNNWNRSKTGWGNKIEKTIILSIDWKQLEEEIPEKPKKKAKKASSPKAVKAPKGAKGGGETKGMPTNSLKQTLLKPSVDGSKLKKDLGVLVWYVMKLKNSLHQENSGCDGADKIVFDIAAYILAIAADSDLGKYNSLDELSKAVTPCKKQSGLTSSIDDDESHTLLLQKLSE